MKPFFSRQSGPPPPPPPPASPLGAAAPVAPPAPMRRARRWQTVAAGSLPSIGGYGLLALFALDLMQIFEAYHSLQPEADANLVMQLVERVAVPLMAYVLIFLRESPDARRFERTVRKLLSIGSLLAAIVYLGLAIMSVSSGVRLYCRAEDELRRQANERTTALKRVETQLPSLPSLQLQLAFEELVRRPQSLAVVEARPQEEMRQQIAAALPTLIGATDAAFLRGSAQARHHQFLISAKYALGGLISALFFFLIWDATFEARAFAIFSRPEDPGLRLEERVLRWWDSFRVVPDLEEYHWYRRLKREWRLWLEKRRARRKPHRYERH